MVQRSSTSPSRCELTITAAPAAARWRTDAFICLIPCGSSPVRGSSKRIAAGLCRYAAQIATFCRIPRLSSDGGKRIRPLLLLLSAKALGSTSNSRIKLGAVVEMLHTATLVHDDIIDEADTRRGRPSSNTTWGNAKCVLAGDWLYMQAFHTALEERNFRVLDLLISLTQQMVEGELLQMEKLGHLINEEEYFDLIYRKTAYLFKVSMQLGGAITHADEMVDAQLGEYGRNLGLAFQVIDDVLDLTAAEDVLGKPVASDLREGKATLAVIHALERGTGADREAIRKVPGRP